MQRLSDQRTLVYCQHANSGSVDCNGMARKCSKVVIRFADWFCCWSHSAFNESIRLGKCAGDERKFHQRSWLPCSLWPWVCMLVPLSRLSSTHNGTFCTYIYARRRHNMLEVGDRAALLTGAGQALPCDNLALYVLELWIYWCHFLHSDLRHAKFTARHTIFFVPSHCFFFKMKR